MTRTFPNARTPRFVAPALAALLLCSLTPVSALAQEDPAEPASTPSPKEAPKKEGEAKAKPAEEKQEEGKKDPEAKTGDAAKPATPTDAKPADAKPADPKPADTKPAPKPAVKPKPTPKPKPVAKPKLSPISDLAGETDQDFVPLQDIEEEKLDPVFPATVYPHVTLNGAFRLRSVFTNNFDLSTGGTSAILPPFEANGRTNKASTKRDEEPPQPQSLWGTDMRIRIEPTFEIIEGIRVHMEADFLDNMVLGSTPVNGLSNANPLRPDPSRNQLGSGQFSPREREWFTDAVKINEAYGEIESFFGVLRAGRMDNHWGMGMFFNGGDCDECNFGDSIDRVMLQTQLFGVYGGLSMDFPNEGATSNQAGMPNGQPYDLSQMDDVRQYSFWLKRAPETRAEKEIQQKELVEDHKPVINGGALFSYRAQDAQLLNPQFDPSIQDMSLIWRGSQMFVVDGWGQFLYQPNDSTMMRVELEVMTAFGSVDNPTNQSLSTTNAENQSDNYNCLNADDRAANNSGCLDKKKNFFQLGLALESEFDLGGPVNFGLNGGLATGGDAASWAWRANDGSDLDFFRFDPDYHVDQILFRNVIGTVTNAYYLNPYLQASFLENGDRKVRFDLDLIVSRAFNVEGTPAGPSNNQDNAWLGVEADAAIRYLIKDTFNASFEGGILFPMGGLGAVQNRPQLTQTNNSSTFSNTAAPTNAWTLQLKLNWNF